MNNKFIFHINCQKFLLNYEIYKNSTIILKILTLAKKGYMVSIKSSVSISKNIMEF